MTNRITHTGWKAIANRLGVRNIDTAKKRVKKFKIPVMKLGNAVALDEAVYCAWYVNFVKLSQENNVFENPIKNMLKTGQTPSKSKRPDQYRPV